MSNSKVEVGYVFKFDCNNTVPRLKGALKPYSDETVSARVSREIKPHPESMTTWYDLEIPTVVHEAFTVRLTAPEIRDMGGELDFLASAPVIADEIIAASIRGDHEEVVSIWTWVGNTQQVEPLIEMHEKVKNAINELQDEVKKDDVEKIKEKTMQLTEAAGKIAEQAYKEEAAKQANAQKKGNDSNAKQADDNVVDADFKEVDDEPKEKKTKTKTK